jgi:hypothetical protein
LNERPDLRWSRLARLHSAELWQQYREIGTEVSVRKLIELLNLVGGTGSDVPDLLSFTDGFSRTMASRAETSRELFAPILTHATSLVFLLPHIDSEMVQSYVKSRLKVLHGQINQALSAISDSITSDYQALLNRGHPLADLYYLPLRITKILGWIGLSALITEMFKNEESTRPYQFDVASKILDTYPQAFAAVSDEQAAPLYIFLKSCEVHGETTTAQAVLHRYFSSFAERKGELARAESDGIRALNFICSLCPPQFRHSRWRPANPSIFAPVLLWFGRRFTLDSSWDLRSLDRLHTGFFIPQNYKDFGSKVVAGANYNNQIGFGIWSLADFEREFKTALANHVRAFELSDESVAVILLASLLFPDRLPLLIEARFTDSLVKADS